MSSQPQPSIDPETGRAIRRQRTDARWMSNSANSTIKIRRLAFRIRWRGSNLTLNPTALAHEAYMKLLKGGWYSEVTRFRRSQAACRDRLAGKSSADRAAIHTRLRGP
jgi:hypothetical protein